MLLHSPDFEAKSSKVEGRLLGFGLVHLFVLRNGLVVRQLMAAPHLLSAQFLVSRLAYVKFHLGQEDQEDSILLDRIPFVAL